MKNFYEISFKFCNQQWIIRQKKCGFSSYYSVKRTGESGVGISLNTWKNRLMEKGSYNQFLSRKDSRCRAGDWRNKEMRSRLDRILVVYGFLMKRPGISIQKTSCVLRSFTSPLGGVVPSVPDATAFVYRHWRFDRTAEPRQTNRFRSAGVGEGAEDNKTSEGERNEKKDSLQAHWLTGNLF